MPLTDLLTRDSAGRELANVALYTPLLPGAAAGKLEPRHVVVPLREELDRSIHLRLGRIMGGSPRRKVIHVRSLDGCDEDLSYDQLIVTVGSVSRTPPIPGLAGHRRRRRPPRAPCSWTGTSDCSSAATRPSSAASCQPRSLGEEHAEEQASNGAGRGVGSARNQSA